MTDRPRVVMLRPNPVHTDSRGKKIALSLARAGYEVVFLSAVAPGEPLAEQWLGPVRVLPVALSTSHQDALRERMVRRRRRTLLVLVRMAHYRERADRARARSRTTAGRLATARRLTSSRSRKARALALVRVPLLVLLLASAQARAGLLARRWVAQAWLDRRAKAAWKAFDTRRGRTSLLATERGALPELVDVAASFEPILTELAPDVIHAHHPTVLRTALRVARRTGAKVVYDARENYGGIPAEEHGSARRHALLVRQEARCIRSVDAVLTVSEPIADELQARYGLANRPSVVLNVPVLRDSAPTTTVRLAAGLGPAVPLAVYSGALGRARGLETLVEALVHAPGLHLALVTVPFPHPRTPGLLELAATFGVGDRVHVVEPVGQEELIGFLSDADVAVHPLPGGSPNHDQAMPNKLFEYLHAGLPLVVSDARLMAAFVRDHDLGEVFLSGDVPALAKALLAALERDPDRRGALAERFSWQAQEKVLWEAYARVWAPGAADARDAFPRLEVVG